MPFTIHVLSPISAGNEWHLRKTNWLGEPAQVLYDQVRFRNVFYLFSFRKVVCMNIPLPALQSSRINDVTCRKILFLNSDDSVFGKEN